MASAAPQPEQQPIFDLADLKRLYREARDNTTDARKLSEIANDYFDDKQWSSDEIKVLRKRKQPEIWVNRMKPAVKGMLGVLEQGQSDPRAFPRNAEDQDAAEVATDSLRYAADKSRWQRTKLKAAKNYLLGEAAAVIVEVNEEGDPWPRLIRDGEFFYDPHSRDHDFEDARYMGIAKWMYADIVRGMYPGSEIDPTAIAPTGLSFDDEDKPAVAWSDQKKNRVLVVEMYVQKQGWKKVCFWGGGILEEGVSPYQDERGTPVNPIVAQSCFVDRENVRYGVARSMIPIQDEINMRRSRLLHMVNSRQLQVSPDYHQAPEVDANKAREEAARPDGVIPFGYQPVPMTDLASGQAQLLQESKSELERMGPNPAVLGQSNADASGRAQLVRQQAGLTELTPDLGGIEDFELRVYRRMWACIKQFWTEPKTVRVTDDIGAAKFLMVNEPVKQQVPAIVPGPNGEPMVGIQEVVTEVRNRPAEMDMDIIIDAVADTANLAAEQFAEIMKLVPIYGPAAFPLKMVIKASGLPKKRELLEELDQMEKEASEGQGPQQQMQQAAFQVEMADKQAKIAETESKTALNYEKATGQQIQNQLAPVQAGFEMGAAAGL